MLTTETSATSTQRETESVILISESSGELSPTPSALRIQDPEPSDFSKNSSSHEGLSQFLTSPSSPSHHPSPSSFFVPSSEAPTPEHSSEAASSSPTKECGTRGGMPDVFQQDEDGDT